MERNQSREEQLSALIDSYGNLVFSLCYKMTSDYFASEDLTQETFLSVYRHLSEFDGQHEKAWVCRIAANKCLDYLRSAGRRVAPMEDVGVEDCLPPDVRGTPEHICLEAEVKAILLARCRALKPPYNEIAKAYYYDEMDAAEIAAQRGMKLKTVQPQIYRARKLLRKLYEKEENGA